MLFPCAKHNSLYSMTTYNWTDVKFTCVLHDSNNTNKNQAEEIDNSDCKSLVLSYASMHLI
jgi:hypothetical protein